MISEKIKKLKVRKKNNDINKDKKSFKDYIIRIGLVIVSFFAINFLVDGIFKVNMMNIVTTKILNSLGVYTEEVRSIEIESSDYSSKAGGSWHIDKSAMWTGRDTAKVTFNLNTILKTEGNYKDIILVIDISGSMIGEKIDKAKSDAMELVNYVLSDSNNKIALITFDDTSEVLSEFTNNKDSLVQKINSITVGGNTNYNSALKNVDIVMDGYKKETNRDVVTLFLTDGYPNEETPNQIGTYAILKDKYPYMSINGVQYEMGIDVIEEIKEITDYQYVADTSTLNNVLFEASVTPEVYENFEIVDYIDNDYFTVESVDDIKVSVGTVTLEEENGVQKITWNLGDNSFLTGGSATMNISLKLKAEYSEKGGYYPTNSKESVTYNLPEENEKVVNSSKTPVLKNNYDVIYDTNPPAECSSIKKVTEEEHFVYESVTKRSDKLTCDGWQFKGWEVVEDVTRVNDEVFVMPNYDVNIRGTWTKQSIAKSMDGTVYMAPNLYNVLKSDAINSKGAVLYTGNGADSFKKNVYYYNGDASTTNNNVIFANFCWKIVRTTETGGVKILYNGVPTDGTCNNTGTASQLETKSAFNNSYYSPAGVGYMYNETAATNYKYNSQSMSGSSYLYGNSFTYDGTNYHLKDTIQVSVWFVNYSQINNNHYTCFNETGECTELSYVYYANNSSAFYINLTGGNSVEDALNEMLWDDNVNGENSTIKEAIDTWYEDNLINYEYYLEDTVFCNDRSVSNLNGWNPNGGSVTSYLYFGANGRNSTKTYDLTCSNKNDSFTMSTSIGNGKLKYPVGLLTMDEVGLSGYNQMKTGQSYWLGSPIYFSNASADEFICNAGSLGNSDVYYARVMSPVVSLKPDTMYSSGDGSVDSPFIVLTK